MSANEAVLRVTELVGAMTRAAARVERLEQELIAAKAAHREIEQELLPDLMRELGLSAVTLNDGTRVEIEDSATAAISDERRAAAHAWLRDHGAGGLIKIEVTVNFGRNEEAQAIELADYIAAHCERSVSVSERVAPQTLKAFVKERLAAGQETPFELFGVHPFSRAKIKAPKSR